MKGIYRFAWDCGRMGELSGIFIATSQMVESIVGKEVYFGEVLGKHSEICGPIEDGEITLVSDEPEHIAMFEKLNLECGHNPFSYVEDEAPETEAP